MTINEPVKFIEPEKKSARTHALPTVCATMSLAEAAVILHIHRTTAWQLYRRGEFPVPVLKVGANLRVVKVHLQRFLDTGEPVTLPFRASDDSRSIAR
jgi:hypothetical protein